MVTACKSVPTGIQVEPLDLLDNESAFYLAIPSAVDPQLVSSVLMDSVEGITLKDAQQISGRINKIYCGLNRSKRGNEYQLSVDANIPVNTIPKLLTEKKGWSTRTFKPENSTSEYKLYSSQGIELSFPSDNIVCAGRNVPSMLTKYEYISSIPADSINEIDDGFSELEPDMYDWLYGAIDEIRFYANKPQSFLSLLTGTSLDLKLFYVKGAFHTDPNFPEQYILDLDFMFKNEKFRKAGKTLIAMAFGLADSQSIIIDSNELQINGIKLNKNQLYKLFME